MVIVIIDLATFLLNQNYTTALCNFNRQSNTIMIMLGSMLVETYAKYFLKLQDQDLWCCGLMEFLSNLMVPHYVLPNHNQLQKQVVLHCGRNS